MPQISAGLLMYRRHDEELHVFLVHPGGPYYQNRDEGHWGIPKGLVEGDEDKLTAAIREFMEETGLTPQPPYVPLPSIQYSSTRKWVHAWAFEGEWDPAQGIHSNTFSMEWPPKSGCMQDFPEVDRAAWYPLADAERKLHPAQWPLVQALKDTLG